MESLQMVRVFKALSCKKRLAMVKMLLGQESCVGAIAEDLNSSQSSVSQHLRVLRDAGLVMDHRDGYHIHYTVNRELFGQMANALSELSVSVENEAECRRKGILCADRETIVSSLKS